MTVDLSRFELTLELNYKAQALDDIRLAEWIKAIHAVINIGEPPLQEEVVDGIARRLKAKVQTTQPDPRILRKGASEWMPGATPTFNYFESYVKYLTKAGMAAGSVAALKNSTAKIVSLLADPSSSEPVIGKGMVVGQVQSGKTGSFIGVINMASDYGYRVVIVLTGMQENLRQQTQERVDYAFAGRQYDASTGRWNVVGVGEDLHNRPHCNTRSDSDFNAALNSNNNVNGLITPLVFVCKKNAKVLQNLLRWINLQRANGPLIPAPLLLIDDEADNASINTNLPEQDPTKINNAIRGILSEFHVATYVGYTATPYANIFIEPPSESDMEKADLFPHDFIVALEPPTNYIGPAGLLAEGAPYAACIKVIPSVDYVHLLPEWHKITHVLTELPPTCEEAVNSYLLSSAIRCSRGQSHWHMSMMVNVSRFTAVQSQVRNLILARLEEVQRAIRVYGIIDPFGAKSPIIRSLADLYERDFSSCGYAWTHMIDKLGEFAPSVKVYLINGRSADVLDYRSHSASGLHVIAVGGLALSRGFTLEGLSTTYILRNVQAYDTLLQMGRWFGYRDDYADVCRIYMSEHSRNWYAYVHDVTDELYLSFIRMAQLKKTPLDFGLRVRRDASGLLVTARDKSRTAKLVELNADLQNVLIETHTLDLDANRANIELTSRFLSGIAFTKSDRMSAAVARASHGDVSGFITEFHYHDRLNAYWSAFELASVVAELRDSGFYGWDVAVFEGESDRQIESIDPALHMQRRAYEIVNGGTTMRINPGRARVAGRGAERAGMTVSEIEAAEDKFEESVGPDGSKNVSDLFYRSERTSPLLMIHYIEPWNREDTNGKAAGNEAHATVVAIGLSIPPCDELVKKPIKYMINRQYQEFIAEARSNEYDED